MRKIRFFLGAILLALCTMQAWGVVSNLYPPDIAAIKKHGVLRVAIYDGDNPPFFSQDAGGKWSGIDIDVVHLIAAQLGVKAVMVPISTYDGIIDAVAAGQADIGLGLVSITSERALRVRFSNPTYEFHPAILVNRIQLSALGWTMWDVVNHLQTLDHPLKIGALASSANIGLLQGDIPHAQIITYPTESDVMAAVANGDVFAGMSDTPEQMNNWLRAHPKAVLTTATGILSTRTVSFGIALSWREENLQQWLNIYLHELDSLRIRQKIYNQYGVEDMSS